MFCCVQDAVSHTLWVSHIIGLLWCLLPNQNSHALPKSINIDIGWPTSLVGGERPGSSEMAASLEVRGPKNKNKKCKQTYERDYKWNYLLFNSFCHVCWVQNDDAEWLKVRSTMFVTIDLNLNSARLKATPPKSISSEVYPRFDPRLPVKILAQNSKSICGLAMLSSQLWRLRGQGGRTIWSQVHTGQNYPFMWAVGLDGGVEVGLPIVWSITSHCCQLHVTAVE